MVECNGPEKERRQRVMVTAVYGPFYFIRNIVKDKETFSREYWRRAKRPGIDPITATEYYTYRIIDRNLSRRGNIQLNYLKVQ